MTVEVKGMIRIGGCEDIKNLTNKQYKKLIKSSPVRWQGRTVRIQRRHSIHVLLRSNPFAKIGKTNGE